MNKGTKALLGILGILGVTAVAAYFLRQAKLLKEICVSATDFNWLSNLYNVLSSVTNPQEGDVAFSLGESKFKGYTCSAWVDFH